LNQEKREVDFAALGDGVPTGDNADGSEQASEDDKPKAQSVDADVIEDGRILEGRWRARPKLTSVVRSAIQLGSLARSGTSVTSTAPASGARIIHVRIELLISFILSGPP
jgi:hypothetical protein